MNSRRSISVLFIILLVATVGAVGYYAFAALTASKQPDQELDAVERPPVAVRVAKVERRRLVPSIKLIGTVLADPERFSKLAAATTGLVEKLVVREGAHVAQGDCVIQLDERPARIALERAEAAYALLIAKPRPEQVTEARALVSKTRAAHTLSDSRLKRSTDLRARNPELVPDVQLLDDQRNEQSARADRETAEAELQLLLKGAREELRRESRVEVEAAQLQLKYCRLTAPFAGEVVEIQAHVGQRADVGTPLAVLLDTSTVIVQARVPGDRLAGARTTAHESQREPVASIRSSSFPGQEFLAYTGWLSQQTEIQTGDVPIKLRVANGSGLLRVGMAVQVELREPTIDSVAVPEAAITVDESGHRVVTLVQNGKALPREIETSSQAEPEIRSAGWVRVLKGLEVGDEVAIENGYALPKDTPVSKLPESPAPPTGH